MRLQDQVCTLLQANKLKEFGIIQFSLFYHIDNMVKQIGYEGIKQRDYIKNIHDGIPIDAGVVRYYSAFTASELGLLLPDQLLTESNQYELTIIKEYDNEWLCRYCRVNNFSVVHPNIDSMASNTQTQVLSDMLIQVLERKKITIEECNKKLIGK